MLLMAISPISVNPSAYISYNNYSPRSLNSPIDSVCFKSNQPFLSNINKFPDLKQHSIKGWEEYYCGPTSLANGITYLSQNGYPNLIKGKNNIETINLMAEYLHTGTLGTTTNNLCSGLKNVLKDSGYTYKSIEYQGLRAVDSEFSKGTLAPNLNWIKAAVEKKGIVLLNIGIYKKENNNYQRKWGHWVTVVGHGFDGKKKNPDTLIIQDPYQENKGNNYFTLEKINEGLLIPSAKDDEITLNQNAQDYYKINSDIPYLKKDEIPILNGVIALEMESTPNQVTSFPPKYVDANETFLARLPRRY